MSRLFFQTLT